MSTTRQVPSAALRFDAGAVQFNPADTGVNTRPIKMVARTGDAITHWYWGRVIHDLSGMALGANGDRVPVDYCHDDSEILGYLDQFDTKSGDLVASGQLVPFAEGDRVNEITAKAAAGVPYQASIYFDPGSMVVEEVPIGIGVTVNGNQFTGPGVVIRKWMLRGVAVCPYGADPGTSSQFKQNESIVTVQFRQENQMSTAQATTALTESTPPTPAASDATETVAPPLVPKPATPAGASCASAPSGGGGSGGEFMAAFGVQGAVWFAEGKSWDEAQKLFVESLKAENEQLKQKLAAVDRGADEPVKFQVRRASEPAGGDTNANTKRLTAALGANLGRFAAGIKIVRPQGAEDPAPGCPSE